jgi:hypothetical protein
MIDITRTSASRPELLKESTESMLKNLKYSGKLRWFLHEDVINREASNICVEYSRGLGIYEKVETSQPPIGQGFSLSWLLDQVETPYAINWEDDYIAMQEIPLDLCVAIFDQHKEINQIAFQKRSIMEEKPGFKKKQIIKKVELNGEILDIDLVVNPHWSFIPSIYRVSWLKSKWVKANGLHNGGIHWDFNIRLKGKVAVNRDAEWVMENMGTYFLGRFGSGHYTYHIGGGKSLREGKYKW